jgi:hypothetical protein
MCSLHCACCGGAWQNVVVELDLFMHDDLHDVIDVVGDMMMTDVIRCTCTAWY